MKKFLGLAAILLMTAFPFAVQARVDCTECHGEDGEPAINISVFNNSVHGGMACTDCHVNADKNMDNHPDNLKAPTCTDCHEEIVHAKLNGLHKKLTCSDCHGDIHTLDPEKSVVGNAELIMNMCSKCHMDPETHKGESPLAKQVEAAEDAPPTYTIIKHYRESVHYLKKKKDGTVAATCVDCHGGHDMKKMTNPASNIYKRNLSHTCGRCHQDVEKKYDDSIHGKAVQRGWDEAPTCTDCHNSHMILATDSPEALTGKRKVAEKICLTCHEDQRLIQRYGLDRYIGSSYRDSYHSMANARKGGNAATCIDCHTTHDILKPSNPRSSTNPNNVTKTCAKCHKEATPLFATSYDHKSSLKSGNIINYYVRMGYFWLIILVIGGMFVHNMGIYISSVIRKYRKRKNEKMITRMTRGQIIIHTINLLAFFVLVVTGFSLRFSHVAFFNWLMSWLAEGTRALVHRIAGVIMMLLFLAHFLRILLGKADRRVLLAMLPKPRDIRDFKDNMRYIFLQTDERPRFGKTTYAEKMEYLALLWGTVVMIVTGLVLWFPTEVSSFLPGWAIKVSETVHFYEAILATMAIFFWHFFFVILNPDVYPLDFTFLDGKMPVEEIEEQRAEWYEELKERGEIKE